jgi:hypothetical protein
MVSRLSTLFFGQSSQDSVSRPAGDNLQGARASHTGVTPNPLQRADFPKKTVRHAKAGGALLGSLRSLQYRTQPQKPPPPLPADPARDIGELQKYFWFKDSLHSTTSQLNRCSDQLDQIHGSASEVRRELEGLQVELELLQRKMQNGVVDHVKIDELGDNSPTPANTTPPEGPAAVQKATGIQPKIVDGVKNEKPRSEEHNLKPATTTAEELAVNRARSTIISKNDGLGHAQNEKTNFGELPSKSAGPAPTRRPVIAKPSSIQQRVQFFSKFANR